MAIKFHVSKDLQAFIAGFGSKSVANLVINRGFSGGGGSGTGTIPLPITPGGKRYAMMFDQKYGGQYNVTLTNLDGSSPFEITLPR